MSIFKCKMCGGTLEISNSETVGVCEYCGTKQTLPKTNDEVITNLFNRANNLRLKCEFDKATQIYEKIVEQEATEAEAYWGMVLCKYGIEYVEDSKTFERIPTCHRTLYESVTSDVDYIAALEHADSSQRMLYEEEAKTIDNIQKNILNIVKTEEPFDVFICYKETDEFGKRTVDSVIANDIYHELVEEGLKVFYSAITLEEKLGQEYEPYIFSALNSAKVMLVIGTKPEYFEAVWVKNEWSRFLKLMKNDRSRLLIPCYKDMDAYELPEEFAHFQAQDMGKIGFVNDVIRGIKKVLLEEATNAKEEVIVSATGTNEEPLLKRAFMFLEDGEFERADEFCEQALNIKPENARAYLGKLMAELRVKKQEDLSRCDKPFDAKNNYQKVLRFADEALAAELRDCIAQIRQRNREIQIRKTYAEAVIAMESNSVSRVKQAISLFESIVNWKDSEEKIAECKNKIERLELEAAHKTKRNKMVKIIFASVAVVATVLGLLFSKVIIPNSKYNKAVALMDEEQYEQAIAILMTISDYKDSKQLIKEYIYNIHKFEKLISAGGEQYYSHVGGVKSNGTVVATGKNSDGQCNVSEWADIIEISAGRWHTVGLKSDGTVVALGHNGFNQCNVSEWTDIVEISADDSLTVGLKSDGTVVYAGYEPQSGYNVSEWTDIVAVSAGSNFVFGLKSNGTVVATGKNSGGQCNVSKWTDIVAISAGDGFALGLKSDGTVKAVGWDSDGQCDVSKWQDIIAISAGERFSLGLKLDGTVVITGNSSSGLFDVSEWTNIVAISAGNDFALGLKSDGTIVVAGNDEWKDQVSDWKLFD